MITAIICIADAYYNTNITGWVYFLTVIQDLVIISKIGKDLQ